MQEEQIKELIDKISRSEKKQPDDNIPLYITIFGIYSIPKADYINYLNTVNEELGMSAKKFSSNFIEEKAKDYIIQRKKNHKISWQDFLSGFNNITLKKVTIVSKIYNILLDCPKFELGDASLYQPQTYIKEHPKESVIFYQTGLDNSHTVNTTNAPHSTLEMKNVEIFEDDKDKVAEIVDDIIKNIITVLAFTIGNRHYAQSLTGQFEHIGKEYMVIGDKSSSTNISSAGSSFIAPHVTLKSQVLSEVNHHLFNILNKTHRTKIEEKIRKSVIWLGRSLRQEEVNDGFMFVSIGLECLLTYEEKGYIKPSIMASLAEGVAFLLAETAESRQEIYKKIKSFYGKRSSIVHNGSVSLPLNDYQEFFVIIQQAIYKMAEWIDEFGYTDIEAVTKHIEKLKFS